MKHLDADFTRKHYFDLEERLGADIYNSTATFIRSSPSHWRTSRAVVKVRKIIGSTYPDQGRPRHRARRLRPPDEGVLGGSGNAVMNLVHAPGNSEEAKYEVDLWFEASEQFEYQTPGRETGLLT